MIQGMPSYGVNDKVSDRIVDFPSASGKKPCSPKTDDTGRKAKTSKFDVLISETSILTQ
jgi:hypothetical protein